MDHGPRAWGRLRSRHVRSGLKGQAGSRGMWGYARGVHSPKCRFHAPVALSTLTGVGGLPSPGRHCWAAAAGPPPLGRRRWAAATGPLPLSRRRWAAAAGPSPPGRRGRGRCSRRGRRVTACGQVRRRYPSAADYGTKFLWEGMRGRWSCRRSRRGPWWGWADGPANEDASGILGSSLREGI